MSYHRILRAFVTAFCLFCLVGLVLAGSTVSAGPSIAAGQGILRYTVPAGQDADLILRRQGADLELRNGETTVVTRPLMTTIAILINGAVGHTARLTVDYTDGAIPLPIMFNASAGGQNTLTVQGGTFDNAIYAPMGAATGTVSMDTATLSYTNLKSLLLLSPGSLDVILPAWASVPVRIVDGPAAGAVQTTEINDGGTGAFCPIDFAHQSSVTVRGNEGSNAFWLNNPNPAADLSALNLEGSNAGNTFDVDTTIAGGATTVRAGIESDMVNVHATSNGGPLHVEGTGGALTVLLETPATSAQLRAT